ncbi:MAG TPA: hypothetical protein VFW94_23470 [Candidatus Acidoferrales bacterium]|nr:hypothetical protein [Candidatus Acidoferrales bacterium]
MSGWIGVDLDGTLAQYGGWVDEHHIGAPIPAMVERVKQWLSEGREVRIFTARVAVADGNLARSGPEQISESIQQWCEKHIGQRLAVTNVKDFGMICLYDDRCIQVERNTGRLIGAKEE